MQDQVNYFLFDHGVYLERKQSYEGVSFNQIRPVVIDGLIDLKNYRKLFDPLQLGLSCSGQGSFAVYDKKDEPLMIMAQRTCFVINEDKVKKINSMPLGATGAFKLGNKLPELVAQENDIIARFRARAG